MPTIEGPHRHHSTASIPSRAVKIHVKGEEKNCPRRGENEKTAGGELVRGEGEIWKTDWENGRGKSSNLGPIPLFVEAKPSKARRRPLAAYLPGRGRTAKLLCALGKQTAKREVATRKISMSFQPSGRSRNGLTGVGCPLGESWG